MLLKRRLWVCRVVSNPGGLEGKGTGQARGLGIWKGRGDICIRLCLVQAEGYNANYSRLM